MSSVWDIPGLATGTRRNLQYCGSHSRPFRVRTRIAWVHFARRCRCHNRTGGHTETSSRPADISTTAAVPGRGAALDGLRSILQCRSSTGGPRSKHIPLPKGNPRSPRARRRLSTVGQPMVHLTQLSHERCITPGHELLALMEMHEVQVALPQRKEPSREQSYETHQRGTCELCIHASLSEAHSGQQLAWSRTVFAQREVQGKALTPAQLASRR